MADIVAQSPRLCYDMPRLLGDFREAFMWRMILFSMILLIARTSTIAGQSTDAKKSHWAILFNVPDGDDTLQVNGIGVGRVIPTIPKRVKVTSSHLIDLYYPPPATSSTDVFQLSSGEQNYFVIYGPTNYLATIAKMISKNKTSIIDVRFNVGISSNWLLSGMDRAFRKRPCNTR